MTVIRENAYQTIVSMIEFYNDKLEEDLDLLKVHLDDSSRLIIDYYINRYNEHKKMLQFYKNQLEKI